MRTDNFHRMVEKEMKAMDKVFDFQDFFKCVNNVGNAVVMSHTEFFDLKKT